MMSGALAIVAELDAVATRVKTPPSVRNELRSLLADLRTVLEAEPATEPPPVEPPTGSVIVSDSAGLTAACAAGGTYQLAPGTYNGNFVVTAPLVLTGAPLPEGRVAEGATAAYRLEPADGLKPTLSVQASRVRITGVTIVPSRTDRAVVLVGSSSAVDPLTLPDDVVFDRVEVLALAAGGKRGIEAHCRGLVVTRSRVMGFWFSGADSQAFLAINGPGPYLLDDCQLQASGENVMFGGGSTKAAAMVPTNVIIRKCLLDKPSDWPGKSDVKNLIEFKSVKGALVEANVLDGNWKDAQDGSAIVITPRNQYGDSPWTVVEDVVVRGNIVRHTPHGYGVSILGHDNEQPSLQTARITIEGNLFEECPNGVRTIGGVDGALVIRNNTLPKVAGNFLQFSGTGPSTPLTVTSNVTLSGAYGISGDGSTGPGVPSLALTTVVDFTGNIIEKTAARTVPWPAGNTLLAPGGLAPLLDADRHYTPDPSKGW